MEISTERPPCWEEANRLFKIEEKGLTAIFTYGSTIHNPYGIVLTPELIRHEETHCEQQGGTAEGAREWWHNLIRDTEFRIEQEAEAYGAQHRLYCQMVKDRNRQSVYLHECARMLASELYGNVIEYRAAADKIRTYSDRTIDDE